MHRITRKLGNLVILLGLIQWSISGFMTIFHFSGDVASRHTPTPIRVDAFLASLHSKEARAGIQPSEHFFDVPRRQLPNLHISPSRLPAQSRLHLF